MSITVNGKVVNVKNFFNRIFFNGEPKRIDEKKSISANNISRISVTSDYADVQLNVTNSNNINAHFFGNVTTTGTSKFDVSAFGNEVKITAKLTGHSMDSNLHLNLDIPAKVFETIEVKSKYGNIAFSKDLRVKKLFLKSTKGTFKRQIIKDSSLLYRHNL